MNNNSLVVNDVTTKLIQPV